jgi:hypothetical protein
MSVIKPRTRGKHFVEHRTRLDRENHEVLYAYAAFLDEDPEYVLNQLVETVLAKDRDFATWRATHTRAYAPQRPVKTQRVGGGLVLPAKAVSGPRVDEPVAGPIASRR